MASKENYCNKMSYFTLYIVISLYDTYCRDQVYNKGEPRMKLLSRAEEIILTAVLLLESNAYGITIRDHIKKVTGREWSFATIYDPLNKLARKGLVIKTTGEPTSERGGRRKCLYEITSDGKTALREIKEINENVWNEISGLSIE